MTAIQSSSRLQAAPPRFSAHVRYAAQDGTLFGNPVDNIPHRTRLVNKYPIINDILDLPMVKAALTNTPDNLFIHFAEVHNKLAMGYFSPSRNATENYVPVKNIFANAHSSELMRDNQCTWIISNTINGLWDEAEGKSGKSGPSPSTTIPIHPLIAWLAKHSPRNNPNVLWKAIYKALTLQVHPDTNSAQVLGPHLAAQELNEWAEEAGLKK